MALNFKSLLRWSIFFCAIDSYTSKLLNPHSMNRIADMILRSCGGRPVSLLFHVLALKGSIFEAGTSLGFVAEVTLAMRFWISPQELGHCVGAGSQQGRGRQPFRLRRAVGRMERQARGPCKGCD